MSNTVKLAELLREAAQEIREQAENNEKYRAIKCAQILAGAKGLVQFKQLLKGKVR